MGRIDRNTRARLAAMAVPLVLVKGTVLGAQPARATPRYETAPECPERREWVERLHAKLPPYLSVFGGLGQTEPQMHIHYGVHVPPASAEGPH